MNEKFQLQDSEYEFPYHHIPHFGKNGIPSKIRFLAWGFEYLCYMKHVRDTVLGFKPSSLLDVGCGDGYFLGSIGSAIPRTCGADLSERGIALAKAIHANIDYKCIDAAKLDEQFDVVTAIETLEHIPDDVLPSFVQTLADRTKSGGHIVITVPSVNLPMAKKHYRHYDAALLKKHMNLPELTPIDVTSLICQKDKVFYNFKRFSNNRLWTVELPMVNKFFWNRLWNNRIAPATGGHVVGIFKKA